MSCNYADALSPYDDKGVVGLPEQFDTEQSVDDKSKLLAKWISESQNVVVHTGAGISTAAGIPDFRGPNGVWTLEKKGLKPTVNVSFDEVVPTKTHMALAKLIEAGFVKYIVSQNVDGLHLRSGVKREHISELHGNIFIEQCSTCKRQYVRNTATTTMGQKPLGTSCYGSQVSRRGCRGKLHDTILDWEANLPDDDLLMADYHSSVADLSITLGTTLQIVPSGNVPLLTKKYGGLLAIVNLQATKHDKKANLLINGYVDVVISKVMKQLGLEIPEYDKEMDIVKMSSEVPFEWNFSRESVNEMKAKYNEYIKNFKRKKQEAKSLKKRPKLDDDVDEADFKFKTEKHEDEDGLKTEEQTNNVSPLEVQEQTNVSQLETRKESSDVFLFKAEEQSNECGVIGETNAAISVSSS